MSLFLGSFSAWVGWDAYRGCSWDFPPPGQVRLQPPGPSRSGLGKNTAYFKSSLFLTPLEAKRFHSDIYHEDLGELLQVNLTKADSSLWQVALAFAPTRCVHLEPWAIHWWQSRLSWQALIPEEVSAGESAQRAEPPCTHLPISNLGDISFPCPTSVTDPRRTVEFSVCSSFSFLFTGVTASKVCVCVTRNRKSVLEHSYLHTPNFLTSSEVEIIRFTDNRKTEA